MLNWKQITWLRSQLRSQEFHLGLSHEQAQWHPEQIVSRQLVLLLDLASFAINVAKRTCKTSV